MATNLLFIPLVYFCYPETTNLTLEEVDNLFITEGEHDGKTLTTPNQPVQESLEAQHPDDDEKLAGGIGASSAEHVEAPDEIKDDKSG
ncbi:hypothetical protein LTR53_007415 [Teratosphaeriaceae sp. CCFEE 6253]|nr:hypothetical protein LTR53_007415 [Teratosphaeriaceae sp. CCFEE 6253]